VDLLCIDTSDGTRVAFVGRAGVRRAVAPDPRAHAEHLARMLADVLADATVEAVAVGTGPAPFTGLRVGLVSAQAFALARRIPVYGVPSLALLARQALDETAGPVTVVTDARRREVYSGTFAAAGPDDVRLLGELAVGAPRDVIVPAGSVLVGPGTRLYPADLPGGDISLDAGVAARVVRARLDAGLPLPTAPLYLRRPDVHAAAGRKRATH